VARTVDEEGHAIDGYIDNSLLIMFKRLIKLYLMGISAVFVFDGPTPEIKKRTILERFKQRYKADKNYKGIAQKLIMKVLEKKNSLRNQTIPEMLQQRRSSEDSNSTSQQHPLSKGGFTDEEAEEILKMVDEYEAALEEKEFEERQIRHSIFLKENERLILSNGYTVEAFDRLDLDKQNDLVDYWKDLEKKSLKHQKFDDCEDASRRLLGSFIDKALEEKKVKAFKKELGEKQENEQLKKLGVPSNQKIVSKSRLEWNRQRIMYFFKEPEEEKAKETSIFDLRNKRNNYVSRKQREEMFEEQRRLYSENFAEQINKLRELREEQASESVRKEQIGLQQQSRRIDEANEPVYYGDSDSEQQASEDPLFKPATPNRSDESSSPGLKNNRPGLSQEEESDGDVDLEFLQKIQAGLTKIDRDGKKQRTDASNRNSDRDDSLKPIMPEVKVKKRLNVSKAFLQQKIQGKTRRLRQPNQRDSEGDPSELEEPVDPQSEADLDPQASEPPRSSSPEQQPSTLMQLTQMERLFREDEEVRRHSRSQNLEDTDLSNAVYGWLDHQEQDDFARFRIIEDEDTDSKTQLSEHPEEATIFSLFGGFYREGEDRLKNPASLDRGSKLSRIQQDFINPKVPAQRVKNDPQSELKQLLDLFGVPYITSLSEAEAQCARLEMEGLVDATVTEDCDAFLFGSKRLLRGVFRGGKTTEEYSAEDIEKEIGLSREQLVMLAIFLGCDYAAGIRGVGIVNAMEIVEAYSSFEALQRFKVWAEKPDYWLDKQIYEDCRQKHPKEFEFMEKHKNYKKVWVLPANFPDPHVINAFLDPLVSVDNQLHFGVPDLPKIAQFSREAFGFEDGELELFLKPLQQELQKRSSGDIRTFFHRRPIPVNINSTRLKASIANIKTQKSLPGPAAAKLRKASDPPSDEDSPSHKKSIKR